MEIKFKKLSKNVPTPAVSTSGSAGYDLTAVSMYRDQHFNFCYGTGIAVEIPAGYAGLVFPRSSVSKYGLQMANCVGVIDSDYRGEIIAKFKPIFQGGRAYEIGERCCQLVIVPIVTPTFVEVETLSETERGDGGYGSTGR